ncbi:efflux RND transporter periplasmic adaptor subunit [Pelomonas sp. V22]|uniref:efflux RND transporter periplasmic adaptor subunit n=1 Tax=Pelomonas sp. V22 TaxID=2822139 RepID=UPI0024A8D493|nr:efflux RND transporter periplasmic adaptor subunit [Pelomonas sp. V22]MDI4633578.1 efflux RND transporter periplasmic adaptor subunit [Pelomonas sp. V22]
MSKTPLRPHPLLAAMLGLLLASASPAAEPALKSFVAGPTSALQGARFEGRVEALRQTVLSAQVPGAIVQLQVKAGDHVRAGQLLLQIDARSAEQGASASEAQAAAAKAGLQLAEREFARQQQLFAKGFISQAALDQAEAQFKATRAQLNAQIAQAAAARTVSGQYLVRSPYDGIVSELSVMLGDMAMPGRPLLTVYDPTALRVTAALPQSAAAALPADPAWQIEIPGLAGGASIQPARSQLLPVVDAGSMTQELRLDLPARLAGLVPGQFARVTTRVATRTIATTAASSASSALIVPASALVRRAELDALYVLDAKGRPLLRQVRLGARRGEQVEVLSGLSAGESVVAEPQFATRLSK